MSTDARELTDDELYANRELGYDFDEKNSRRSMKIVQTENGFNGLKNAVFTAFVLGMGCVVWAQQRTNAEFEKEIAILNLECKNLATSRVP